MPVGTIKKQCVNRCKRVFLDPVCSQIMFDNVSRKIRFFGKEANKEIINFLGVVK